MTMTACFTTSPSASRCSTARRAAASQHAPEGLGVPRREYPRRCRSGASSSQMARTCGDSHDGGTTGPRFGTGSALLIRSGRARCNRRMAVDAGVGPRLPKVVIMLIRTDDAALDTRPITGSIISP